MCRPLLHCTRPSMPKLAETEANYRLALPALRSRRVELGLRLVDVAAICGMTASHIARLEKGETRVDYAAQRKITALLEGRAADDFFVEPLRFEWLTATEASRIAEVAVMTIIRAINGEMGPDLILRAERDGHAWLISPAELDQWLTAYRGWRGSTAPVWLTCDRDGCENRFERRPSQLTKDGLNYCSRSCSRANRSERAAVTKITKTCEDCDAPFDVTQSEAERLSRCPTCRARHKATPRACVICGSDFSKAPSNHSTRCPQCIAAGRGCCPACHEEVSVKPGLKGGTLCEACLSGRTQSERLQPGFVRIICRGDEAYNGHQRSRWCERAKVVSFAGTGRLKTYVSETQTYICKHCHGLVIQRKGAPTRMRKLRKLGVEVTTPRSRADLNKLAFTQAKASSRWATPDATRLQGGSRSNSPTAIRRRVAGFWRPPHAPKVTLDLCRWCHTITLQADADVKRGIGPLRYHAECWHAHLATDEGAEWARRRERGLTNRELRELGVSGDLLPALPDDRNEPPRWPNLNRDFGWAVLYYFGRDKQADIAKKNHVSRAVVSEAIEKVMKTLPPPERATQRLGWYVTELKDAAFDR